MLFVDLYSKMCEDEKKACPIDGRRFNSRSRVRMDREAEVIKRSIAKQSRKRKARRGSNKMFSEDEIRAGEEEKIKFREEMSRKKEQRDIQEKEELERQEMIVNDRLGDRSNFIDSD